MLRDAPVGGCRDGRCWSSDPSERELAGDLSIESTSSGSDGLSTMSTSTAAARSCFATSSWGSRLRLRKPLELTACIGLMLVVHMAEAALAVTGGSTFRRTAALVHPQRIGKVVAETV
jgi:hypothetical protein